MHKIFRTTLIMSLSTLYCCIPAFAQQQEIDLIKLDKPIEAFKRDGSSNQNGGNAASMYGKNPLVTPRVSIEEAEDGVVIKADYDIYKFRKDYTQLWKAKLPKVYGMVDFPSMHIVSDVSNTYAVEIKSNPLNSKKMSVVQISNDGKLVHTKYETDVNGNDYYKAHIINGDLFLFGRRKNDKTDKIEYKSYRISQTDHKLTEIPLNLITTDDEYDMAKDGIYVYWHSIAQLRDNIIFVKSYFKDTDIKKVKTVVIHLCELSPDGKVSGFRELTFQPTLAGPDRKFSLPRFKYSPKDNSLTVAGWMEIGDREMDGMYLLKYDYQTGSLVNRHEHHMKDILKPEIKSNAAKESYPSSFDEEDIYIDQLTGFTNVRILAKTGLGTFKFFEVKFDHYGDHIQTGIVDFRHYIHYFRNVIPKPIGYELVWRDKSRPHVASSKPSPWDILNSKANEDKKSEWYFVPITRPDSNGVIWFDQTLGTFKAIVEKK